MFIGLLVAGAGIGAVVAGLWIATGGSALAALALYALVSTGFVLGAALLAYILPDAKAPDAPEPKEALHAAD